MDFAVGSNLEYPSLLSVDQFLDSFNAVVRDIEKRVFPKNCSLNIAVPSSPLKNKVKLNHRKLLDGMLDICGVPPEKFRTICSSVDKLDKQSFEQIKKEMVEEKGLNVETADKIGTFVKQRGRPLELLFELKQSGSKFLENSESLQALDELEILFRALEKSKCISKVVLDPSLARGPDYYTGVIYEAVFKGATQWDKACGLTYTQEQIDEVRDEWATY